MNSLSLNNKEEDNNNKIFSDGNDSVTGVNVNHEDDLTTSDLNDLFLMGLADNPGEVITSTYIW